MSKEIILFLILVISIYGNNLYCKDNLYIDSDKINSNEISQLCINMTNENFHLFFIDNIIFESENNTEYSEYSFNLYNKTIINSSDDDYAIFIFNIGQKIILINEEEIENDENKKNNLNIYKDEILYQIRNENYLIALKLAIFRFNEGKNKLNTGDFYIKTVNNNPNKGINITSIVKEELYTYRDYIKICFELIFVIVVIIFCFYFYKRRRNPNYTPVSMTSSLIEKDDVTSDINKTLIKVEDLFKQIENDKNKTITSELCFICMKPINNIKSGKYIEMSNMEDNNINKNLNINSTKDFITYSCGHSFHTFCLKKNNIDFCILCYNQDSTDSYQLLNSNEVTQGAIKETQLRNFVQNLYIIYDKKDLLETYRKYPSICHTLNSCLLITLPNSWKYAKNITSNPNMNNNNVNINNNNTIQTNIQNNNSLLNNSNILSNNNNNNNDNNEINNNDININNIKRNSKITQNTETSNYKPPKMVNYDMDSKSNFTNNKLEMQENPLNLSKKDENKEINLNVKELKDNPNEIPPIKKEIKKTSSNNKPPVYENYDYD